MSDTQGKADRAKALLDNADLQEAFDDVKQRLVDEFASDSPMHPDYLSDLHKCIEILAAVRGVFYKRIRDGKLEQYEDSQTPFLQDLTNVRH